MKTRQCDECDNFLAEEQTFEGRWVTRVGVCLLGHKPRFFAPVYVDRTTWGYKRKCADYILRGVGKVVGKREHMIDGSMCWCNPDMTYKDPDNGAEVWVHKEPQ